MDAAAHRHAPLLTVHEVAERLRSGEHTIRRLIRSGELPALRVGQQYRIDGDELERWLFSEVSSPVSGDGQRPAGRPPRSMASAAAPDEPPTTRR
jgi:excisionase family DNA binding protein